MTVKSDASDAAWAKRRRILDSFSRRVFDTLKLALAENLTPEVFALVKRYVISAIDSEVSEQMKIYTDEIEVFVSGKTHRTGWWWEKKAVRKYIHVEVIFSPYSMGLSAWTDPTAPDGIVCFQ